MLWFSEPALTVMRVSWRFPLIIRVINDECEVSFWFIEVFAYYVYNFVYLCCLLLEQQIIFGPGFSLFFFDYNVLQV